MSGSSQNATLDSVAILYICTGRYAIFWKEFYTSCEEYFLKGIKKHYFVFTDAEHIAYENEHQNITRIYQANLGFPKASLLRFEFFLSHRELIEKYDYALFFNSNIIFVKPIQVGDMLLDNDQRFLAVYINKISNFRRNIALKLWKKAIPVEHNRLSTAYVDISKKKLPYYVQAGVQGGRSKDFMQACEIILQRIQTDLRNGIMAVWHDESHWNCFLAGRDDVKYLDRTYLFPEGIGIEEGKERAKILVIDKRKYQWEIKPQPLRISTLLEKIAKKLIVVLERCFK